MCDCGGEAWSKRPLRTISSNDDDGERVLDMCESMSGIRPPSCPWSALRDPFVAEALRAHGWREAGQLEVKYPLGVPSRVVWAVEVYASALSAVQVHVMRLDREEKKTATEPK